MDADRSSGRRAVVLAPAAGAPSAVLPDIGDWTLVAMLLTILDAAATWAWLSLGLATEGNPFVVTLIETYGSSGGLVMRTLVGVAFLVGLATLALRHRVAVHALRFATSTLGVVALWHLTGVAQLVT